VSSPIDLHATDSSEPLESEPISPELALVDPDLASFARARLPVVADCLAGRPRIAERTLEQPDPGREAPPAGDERVAPPEPFESLPAADDQAWLDRLRQGELHEPAPLLEHEQEHERPAGAMAGTAAFILLAVLGLFAGSHAWQALRGGTQSPAAAPTLGTGTTSTSRSGGSLKSGRAALPATSASRSGRSPLKSGTAAPPAARAQKKNPPGTRSRSAPPRHSGRSAASPRRSLPSGSRAHVFVWPPVSGARSYRVEFFRRGRKILQATPAKPRLKLPLRWRFRGKAFRLTPGAYVWIVRPVKGSGQALRYGPAVTRSRWVLQHVR
jgi:hypothetical protein